MKVKSKAPLCIGLVYDLEGELAGSADPAPDREGELSTASEIHTIAESIRSLGYGVTCIGDMAALLAALGAGQRPDLIFNYAVGKRGIGREAQIPALLEALQIPYTGADPFSLMLAMDKALVKRIWLQCGLPTAEFCLVTGPDQLQAGELRLPPGPWFVKPAREGSSKGISTQARVSTWAELQRQAAWVLATYRQPALVETYLPGREFSVGILGSGSTARPLGAVEISSGETGFADYSSKRQWKETVFRRVDPPELAEALQELARRAYQALGCQVVGRVDLRLDAGGRPQLMEINPNPTLQDRCCSMSAIAAQNGLSHAGLLEMIVDLAIERWGLAGDRQAARYAARSPARLPLNDRSLL